MVLKNGDFSSDFFFLLIVGCVRFNPGSLMRVTMRTRSDGFTLLYFFALHKNLEVSLRKETQISNENKANE